MSKKLKLATVLMIAFASMNLNAQKKTTVRTTKPKTEAKTAQSATESKPTKLETMDWIAGKMKERLIEPREFVSYTDGKFSYRKWLAGDECITTIDLNKVTGTSNSFSKDYYIKGNQLIYTGCKAHSSEYKEQLSIGGPNYNDYSQPFEFNNDDALVERLKKAFTTLIEYNSNKKGADEKF